MFNAKDSKNNIQVASFLINDPKLTEIWGNVYIVEPSNERERKRGQLIILAALSDFSSQNPQKEIIERIIKEIQTNYYSSNINKEELNIEEIFEATLQKANQEFAKIIRVSQSNWFKKINILVAVVKNEFIYFAQIGSLFSAFLIYEDKIIDIIEKVRVNNISINPLKLFSSITNGSISTNNNIFFTSSGIFDLISSEKIKKIINNWEANSAISKFQNLLSNSKIKNILAGVIIKNVSSDKKNIIENIELIPTNNPLFDLAKQKEKTDRILRASFFSKIQKKLLNLFSHCISCLFYFFKKIFIHSKRKFYIQNRIDSSVKRQEIPKEISNISTFPKKRNLLFISHSPFVLKWINKFRSLSYFSKILFIIFLILALFFISSLIWLARKQSNDNEIKKNNQLIEKIENKQNAVGAALIYKDEEKAKKNLEEILKLSKELPKDSPENLAKLQKIQKETEIQLNKLRNIISIDNPLIIADLNLLDFKNKNFNLVLLNQQLYFYNQDNSIFKFDSKEKKIFFVFNNLQENKQFENAKQYDKNSILFYYNTNELAKFNVLNKDLKLMGIKLPIKTNKIKDFVVYSQKIYSLDSENNQIYKYNSTQTEKSNWIKDEQINLNEGVSLAIDGSIYVLKSNGEILKFLQGKKQEFALKNLEPALENPTKIWTDFNSKYIYILEPSTKRIIISDKQGKVQKQYTSEKFIKLQNFVVDEEKNKLYILADNKVYELKIE
ncbi:hypothetical protein CVV26_00160 [Candidatus Kuenenbacteria bacterium HGW-Kuenenbacteria-1]|uniref:PPM-type phosphatase domain-containing protein n=1 Tax=Candidatus Kuenenbacteria bacterium HGW-Kuenenbacteria-1 TaxID=2013812 RepID=A0A2N1UP93_9BACT|nr:MAG: hypothetical protein CVV26_00160 [Candidatus Kuenenbacteria bacterium HGW-Kuenenbacteria-1]